MNVCPAPDSASVAYFSGSPLASPGLDHTGACPAIPASGGCSGLILDFLGGIGVVLSPMYRLGRLCLMDLELDDIARYVGKAIGMLAFVLAIAAAPVLWVIGALLGALRSLSSSMFSVFCFVAQGVVHVIMMPLLIPWHITTCAWEVALNLYDELEAREPGSLYDIDKDTDSRHSSPSSSTSASPSFSGHALVQSSPS
ncbi:hypothetical protein VTH06DRAFT_6977 [Thermothelomyces fergusii]